MSIHLGYPQALFLLGLIVPVVWWARRSLAGLGRARGATALTLRLAIIVLLVLSLARVQWSFTRDEMTVVYVVDQSLSLPVPARQAALDFVKGTEGSRRSADKVGLVVFGRSAALERRPRARGLFQAQEGAEAPGVEEELAALQSVINPQRTNMAAALRLAMAAFPPSGRKRIVLIGDGNENLGSAAEEADIARRYGVRIDVAPVHYQHDAEVMVEKVVTPSEVDKKAGFEVRVVVRAHNAQRAVLRLYENGHLIASEPVDLKPGINVRTVRRTLPDAGYYTYSAVVESANDTLHANNQGSAFTVVRGEGRVLLVEGDPRHGAPLLQALKQQGLDVTMVGQEALPLKLGSLIGYDTVILSDISAGALGQETMRAIELATQAWGVGLVMVGGEHAYGPGGYQGSPVERALPVRMDIKQRRVIPSGALVIILHTCEIARGNYWARQIALAALKVLSPNDEYGILYYDWTGGVKWLFQLQKMTDKTAVAALINNVSAGDMPSFIPAFTKAHIALKKSDAAIKHVVVISDGDPSYPTDKEVLAMVSDKITVTTVGISPHTGGDAFRMAHVANIGKGRYYEPQNSDELPQIFIKEAATVRRSLILEERFRPAVQQPSQTIKGIRSAEFPSLEGYVVTTPKPLADVPLITHKKDPLLAHWQYGLGKAVAFTSDAKARWAAPWVSWDKYARFWGQVARWSAKSIQPSGIRARTEIVEDRGRLVIDAVDKDGTFMNNLTFDGTLVDPEKSDAPLRITQTGPGRYEAEFDVNEAGTHYLSLRYKNAKGENVLYTHGLVVPYSAEYRELTANEPMLASLAKATDGRVLDLTALGEDTFVRSFPAAPRLSEGWPLMLLIAILLVPADVFVRRVFVDYGAAWRRVTAGAMAVVRATQAYRWLGGRPAERPSHVSALLSAKERTREQMTVRGKKFEPADDVELVEPTLTPDAEPERPAVRPDAPRPAEPEGPTVVRDDETYLGRLLKAKREAKESKDDGKAGGNRGNRGHKS